MSEFDEYWIKLVSALEWCLNNYEPTAFTMQTKNPLFEFGPYVQAQYLDDEIEIEITSNQYLRPHINGFYVQRMEFLGWNMPDDDDHPNFWLSIPNTPEAKRWAAELWVRTLLLVFLLPHRTTFRLAPFNANAHREVSKHLVDFYGPMSYALWDIRGSRRAQVARERADEQAKQAARKAEADLTYEVNSVLRRALDLRLQGTDVIRVAETMASPQVVQIIRDLVYGVVWRPGLTLTNEQFEKLGIYEPHEHAQARNWST